VVPVTPEKIETVTNVEPTLEEVENFVIPHEETKAPANSEDIHNSEDTNVQPTTTHTETQASEPLNPSSTTS